MKVALATCDPLPEPDPDETLLLSALREAGVEPVMAVWNDPDVDWAGFDRCVLRSTWDYTLMPQAFLEWVERVATVTELLNPAPIVQWNAHKQYLLELETRGVPAAQTTLLRRGADTPLARVLEERGWVDVVIKPAISAGSRDTLRARSGEYERGEEHLRRLLAQEDVLVQAYLPAVEDHGERALVWIDGEFTHSVRKHPRFQADDETVDGPLPIGPLELELGNMALGSMKDQLLYARVDVVPGPDGVPVVCELELIEPSLFLLQYPAALARLAAAIARP